MEGSDGEPSDIEEEENYPQGRSQSESDGESGNEEDKDDEGESVPSQSEPEEGSDTEERHVSAPPPKRRNEEEPEPAEDLPSTLRKTREEDRKKGKAVSQQIVRVFRFLTISNF